MHTQETRYFRTEEEAQAFADNLRHGPANEVYLRLPPTLSDAIWQDTQTRAWMVKYEEFR